MFSNFYENSKASSDSSANNVPATTPNTAAKAPKKRRRRRKGKYQGKSVNGPNSNHESNKKLLAKRLPSSDLAHSHPSKRSKRQPPSEAALALSAKLKEYSTQKRLDDALKLYWHESNDSIRDEHHACIMIDCSARCGAIAVSVFSSALLLCDYR